MLWRQAHWLAKGKKNEYETRPDRMFIRQLEIYIEDGTIKVPKFQREFVWEVKKSAELLDSILKESKN